MRIVIMGAGAVGAYYGGALARNGGDVALVARGDHAEAMRREGLRVESHWGDYVVHPRVALTPDEAGVADLVLHCVKLYSNAETIPTMQPLVGDGTVILTVQNGITGGESLASEFGWEKVLEGATYIETSVAGPGYIVQTGSAACIEFGERDGSVTQRVQEIRDVLSVPGIQVDVSSDIQASLWSKMVAIGALGTIVTAARASLPEVLAMDGGLDTIRTVMEEIVASGKANGVKFADGIVEEKLADAIAEADEFQSSLQSDFNRGGKLELDDILGAAVRLGRASGIPMPASTALVMTLQKFKDGA
ncbi:MAG: 2-dehydropantoate 2-reductase [Chloroflexi bacterium]|nr:2-dehydropantoate 2-reductase [Chloroflexota bacterium]MYK61016.1 2-dehydropantoate 2-reductase [Chloroflexota bacterium]